MFARVFNDSYTRPSRRVRGNARAAREVPVESAATRRARAGPLVRGALTGHRATPGPGGAARAAATAPRERKCDKASNQDKDDASSRTTRAG